MKRKMLVFLFATIASLVGASLAVAHAPSGAIFTTLPDGSAVNANIYDSRDDVYLDGGPGPGAPATAAGLDDGTYVFQVTNPSGATLLSLDEARCRQFTVAGGLISGVVVTGCEHLTGLDIDQGAATVQLMPYAETPNNGGVYKVWVVEVGDFLAGCAALGVPNGLDVVDCGNAPGNRHGFVPSHSKTDNFKVRDDKPGHQSHSMIKTWFFYDHNGDGTWTPQTDEVLEGKKVIWQDTLGASNVKWSYSSPVHDGAAQVETPEKGTHFITVASQPGCTVDAILVNGNLLETGGPQTVAAAIKGGKDPTIFIDVICAD